MGAAAIVGVPEATSDLDHVREPGENDVGSAWQPADVLSVCSSIFRGEITKTMNELGWVIAGVLVTGGVGLAGAIPATLNWLEARRLSRLMSSGGTEVERESSYRWNCGIYDYPPLSVFPSGEGAQPSGPLVYLAREVLNAIGRSPIYCRFSYTDFYESEHVLPDVVVGMFETTPRSKKMIFSAPLYKIGLQGLCRIDDESKILEGSRAGTKTAAVYDGEVGWEYAVRHLPEAIREGRIVKVSWGRQTDTLAHLVNGECDVVIMDELSCANFLKKRSNARRFKFAFKSNPAIYEACIAVRAGPLQALGGAK